MTYCKLNAENYVEQVQPTEGPGFQECPDDVICGQLFEGGEYVDPSPVPKTEEQMRDDFKKSRAKSVSEIKVTTAAGNEFDGDEESQGRMVRAVLVANSDAEETQWVLANNSVVMVSAGELKEALRLAGEAQTALWFQ